MDDDELNFNINNNNFAYVTDCNSFQFFILIKRSNIKDKERAHHELASSDLGKVQEQISQKIVDFVTNKLMQLLRIFIIDP